MRLASLMIAMGCTALGAAAGAGCDRDTLVRDQAVRVPASAMPASGGQPAFVGAWAAARAACGHAAWVITANQLQAPGAVRCQVGTVTPTLAGYTMNSACSSGGADSPGRIVVTLSGGPPATAMTLQGGPFAEPVSLVRCPA